MAQGPLVIFCDFEDRNSPQDDIQRLSLNYVVEIGFFLGFFFLVFVLFCFVLGVVFFFLVFFLSLGFIGVLFRLCYVRSTIFRLYEDVTVVGKEAARLMPVLGTSMHPQQGGNTCCQFLWSHSKRRTRKIGNQSTAKWKIQQKDQQSEHCQV